MSNTLVIALYAGFTLPFALLFWQLGIGLRLKRQVDESRAALEEFAWQDRRASEPLIVALRNRRDQTLESQPLVDPAPSQ